MHLLCPVLWLQLIEAVKLENLATCRVVYVCFVRIIDICDFKSLLVCADCSSFFNTFSACFLSCKFNFMWEAMSDT